MANIETKITFRGMEHSEATKEYVEGGLGRVERLLSKEQPPIHLEIILEAGRTHHHHRVELILKSPHFDLVAHDESPELYASIDAAVHKLFSEVSKAKEKRIDKRKDRHTPKGDFARGSDPYAIPVDNEDDSED